MTTDSVALNELLVVRERLFRELQHGLDANECNFLLSLVRNQTDWGLLDIPHLADLPGIRWKVQNLEQFAKANPKRFIAQAEALQHMLGLVDRHTA